MHEHGTFGITRLRQRAIPIALFAAVLCGGSLTAAPALAADPVISGETRETESAGPVIPTPEAPHLGGSEPDTTVPTDPAPTDPELEQPGPAEPGIEPPGPGDVGAEHPLPPVATVPPAEESTSGGRPEAVPDPPNSGLTVGTVAVSGTPRVGQRLHARLDGWAAAGARFSYQWQRGGAALRGATAAHYTPVAADRDERLSVTVTARPDGAAARTVASPVTEVVTFGELVPRIPRITGSPIVGATLTASTPAWVPDRTKLSFQWLRDGAAIPRATGERYQLAAEDAGTVVAVTVTGELTGYVVAAQTSESTTPVLRTLAGAPVPRIAGSPRVGGTVSVRSGSWNPGGVALATQWYRDGAPIPGATSDSYQPNESDAAAILTVSVTGTMPGYAPATKTSAGITVPQELRLPQPRVRGAALVGEVLTVELGAWPSGTIPRMQWFRGAIPVPGATSAHYVPGVQDQGLPLRVLVRGERAGYAPDARLSAPTRIVRELAPARLSNHAE